MQSYDLWSVWQPVLIFSALMVVMGVLVFGWQKANAHIIKHLRKEIDHYQNVIKNYDQIYLRRSGKFEEYGDYDLLSLDGGLTWYEIAQDDDGSINLTFFCNQQIIDKILAGATKEPEIKESLPSLDDASDALESSFQELGITVNNKNDK